MRHDFSVTTGIGLFRDKNTSSKGPNVSVQYVRNGIEQMEPELCEKYKTNMWRLLKEIYGQICMESG